MLTKSENNNAIIAELCNVRPHPNADRLKLATVLGTQVVVGLDAKDGDVVIYFDSNLCLSPEYLKTNNLYSNAELNADPTKKGYFGKHGRIKAQRFRGEVSNGYVATMDTLITCGAVKYYDDLDLQVGDEFTHVNGVKICEKYIIPTNYSGDRAGLKRTKQPISEMFWKHWDTKHLMRESHRIAEGMIYIEEKIHGTSARTGNVLCRTNRPWWKFWLPKEEWKVVSGTRRVDQIGNHMPDERKEVEEMLAPHLHQGEQVYYEIFGNCKNGSPVQADWCRYGCIGGKYRVMLYRVTITTPDGFCVDLPREMVYKRAEELGLEKPELLGKTYFVKDEFVEAYHDPVERWKLEDLKEYAEGKSALDANTIREGIVVWFMDKSGKWDCLKLKSEEFLMKDSSQQDAGIGDVEDNL